SARGDTVVAAWNTMVVPGRVNQEIMVAFSSDHGHTFDLRQLTNGPKLNLFPVAAAWGPDPQGAGIAWWTNESEYSVGDSDVMFAPMSSATPDVGVVDVRPVQAAQDATRLAAGHPTTIRALLRSRSPRIVTVKAKIELSVDGVVRTIEEDVMVRPGL